MKPIKLIMTAFGPFAGQEMIDFEEIAKEPVFLICGPTGAGKTTIFDAISYALFGDASGEERKPDGMRSDFASEEVLTEVEFFFEVKGKLYRVMRRPKQNRRKKSGEGFTEVPAKAELEYQDDRGEPLVFTKNAEISEKIKEIIGLGSEQFKQIMMLPQGEFRKLLTADSKERETILREIFDAERYLRFQLNLKEEADKLEREIKEIRNIQNQWILQIQARDNEKVGSLAEILQREEIDRQELFRLVEEQNLQDAKESEEIRREAERIGAEINRQNEILFCQQQENQKLEELTAVQAKMRLLIEEKESIQQKEWQANQIQNAVSLKPYAENCRKIEYRIGGLEAEKVETSKKLEQITLEKEKIEREYQFLKSPKYRQQEEMADRTAEELKRQIPLMERLLKLKQDYARLLKEVKKKEQKLTQVMDGKKILLEKVKKEKSLLAETEDIESRRTALEKKQNLYRKVKEMYDRLLQYEMEIEKIVDQEKELSEQLANAGEYYQAELNKARHNHVIAIRSGLQDGDICPVCQGSYHCSGEITELANQAADLDNAEKELERCRLEKEKHQQKKTEAVTRRDTLMEQILQESNFSVRKEIEQYLDAEDKEQVEDEARATEYRKLSMLRKEASENLSQWESNLEQMGREEEISKEEFDRKRSELDQVIGEGKHLKESVLPEYRDKATPEAVEDLKAQLSELEKAKRERQRKAEELENSYHRTSSFQVEIKTRYELLIGQQNEMQNQLQEEKSMFLDRQKQLGFTDEASWQLAVEKEALQFELTEEVKQYREELIRTSDLEKRLLSEVKINKAHNLESMVTRIKEAEEKKERYNAESVLLLDRAGDNTRILEKLRQMERRREMQKSRYGEISMFAKVANGENSKRLTFERYVLAAFLDDVLQTANHRLEKMTGRYSLKRKEEVTHRGRQSGLEIEVFDAYTGKTRSIHTLSGGEGFKSALAMALGLSEVVSTYAGGIELDLLFIDEGFGTLDPESLDTAIDCIMDLQAKGKVIGIISHVSELKERIPAKLEVRQTPKGSYTEYRSSGL